MIYQHTQSDFDFDLQLFMLGLNHVPYMYGILIFERASLHVCSRNVPAYMYEEQSVRSRQIKSTLDMITSV